MNELTLGDAALDRDHARLHDLSEELLVAAPARYAHVVDELRIHARAHFSAEDADLVDMKDGNAKCHLDEHQAVLKSLDEVHALLVGDEHGPEAKERVVRSLAQELLRWLPHHVQEMDAGVATWRSRQRFGGAPVQITRRRD